MSMMGGPIARITNCYNTNKVRHRTSLGGGGQSEAKKMIVCPLIQLHKLV